MFAPSTSRGCDILGCVAEYSLTLSDAEVARYRLMAEAAERSERELWAAAGAVPGAKVADVGCGPGAVSVRLASMVAPAGQVWAVDRDPVALAVARELAARAEVPVRTEIGLADDTGLAPDTFDLVMLRHVLAHNGGAEQAIVDHLAGLARPGGGTVYLTDIYFQAFRFRGDQDPALADLTDRYRELHRRRGDDLDVGARLDELLRASGLDLVHYQGRIDVVTPPPGLRGPAWAARDALVSEGLATDGDVARWDAAFNQATGPVTFFASTFNAFARRR